jgi:DNA-binding transcriptional MerR regulator
VKETLHPSEVAKLTGISPDTVRYYERNGLLPLAPRTAGGYRLFPRHALRRVKIIQRSLSLGFTVKELSAIFRERERGGRPCERVRQLGVEKLASLEKTIRELKAKRNKMKRTLLSWDKLLRTRGKHEHAYLLETFSGE